jgi:parallel beta-helix repeat protein
MKYIDRHLAVVTGILIALARTAVPAQAAFKNITTCNPALAVSSGGSLINSSGDYQLTGNLTQSTVNTDCILITVSNVSLKLNDHQISGPGVIGNGAGIDINPPTGRVNHVAIEGPGLIQGFGEGVSFNNADYSQVGLVTAANNVDHGIHGFVVTYLTVSSNVLVRNGLFGLSLNVSFSGTIQNNEASGNGAATGLGTCHCGAGGIELLSSDANTVNNNTANGNGPQSGSPPLEGDGIYIWGSSNENRVYGNTTDGNIFDGIQIDNFSSGNQVFNNTSSVGNGAYDLEDDHSACGTDFWGSNTFFTKSQACIN